MLGALQVVRLGGALYPWAAAAPAIIGALAFGGRWDSALSAGAGIPVAPPVSAAVDASGVYTRSTCVHCMGGLVHQQTIYA